MLIKGELEFIKKVGRLGINEMQLALPIVQEKLKEVEEQLIRGDKYETMWKTFQMQQGYCFHKDNYRKHYSLTQLMYDFEQKYFGKPKQSVENLMGSFLKGVELSMRHIQLQKEMKEFSETCKKNR